MAKKITPVTLENVPVTFKPDSTWEVKIRQGSTRVPNPLLDLPGFQNAVDEKLVEVNAKVHAGTKNAAVMNLSTTLSALATRSFEDHEAIYKTLGRATRSQAPEVKAIVKAYNLDAILETLKPVQQERKR